MTQIWSRSYGKERSSWAWQHGCKTDAETLTYSVITVLTLASCGALAWIIFRNWQ
ncbi:hypothetical protein ABLE91_28560 [Aquabacter sp. CN5-332]|uniref:hypothetical protein n=1 Tax=Aquabacter sp. CN5-332 TaxID=3156608 RepID=UPI0032B3AD2F